MTRFKGSVVVMAAVLFLAGGAFVFATGQNEAPGPQGQVGTATGSQVSVGGNLLTVTGQVHFVNLILPVITSGSSQYELIVPRYEVYQSGVTEGQTVTVKGYEVKGGAWGPYYGQASSSTPKLLVSAATIGAKSYDLQDWADHVKTALKYRGTYGPRGRFEGPGYGPMSSWGPREGRGYGRGPRGWEGRGYGPMMFGPGYGGGYGPMGFGPGYGGGYGPMRGYGPFGSDRGYGAPQSNSEQGR